MPKYHYWLGDEDSFDTYLALESKSFDVELRSMNVEEETPDNALLSNHQNVSMVTIKGGIVSSSNWVTKLFGIPSYPDIREALILAEQDSTTDKILLHIDSPGGAAKGIEMVSDLLLKISKPVYAYTDGMMASAAYWIGASAKQIYASKMATVGSIGVITVHQEITKMLANEGIKATVLRAGQFKALGGPYEKLTPQAQGIIQHRLDAMYNEFVAHVAKSRKTTSEIVHNTMADGREFLAAEAHAVGLIDGIMSIDDMMSKLTKPSKSIPVGQQQRPTRMESTNVTSMEADDMAKQTKFLTEQQAALLTLTGSAELPETPETPPAPEASAPEVPEVPETPPAPEASAEAPVAAALQPADDGLVSYLKAELATANQKLVTMSVEQHNIQAQVDAMNATHAQMRTIVEDFSNLRKIALGGTRSDLSSLSDEALLQHFTQVNAEFGKSFKIGGVAQPPSDAPDEGSMGAVVMPMHAARIGAVRPVKK